jgi:succinate-acetate transporter protein
MTVTLASFGWLSFKQTNIMSYVAGSAMGTFIMLYVYIFFFDKIKDKAFTSQKNMNYIIGSITGLIAIVTLINILKEM